LEKPVFKNNEFKYVEYEKGNDFEKEIIMN